MTSRWRARAMTLVPGAGLRAGLRQGLLVAVVLGVIAMHHVVAGHGAHAASDPTPLAAPASAAASVPAPAHHSARTGPGVGVGPAAPADAPSTSASVFVGHDSVPAGTGMAMMLHLCLAVLAALVALAALTLAWWQDRAGPDGQAGPGLVRVRAVPRAPPLPVRLAQLQVLRL